MDGPTKGWYFSTVPRRSRSRRSPLPTRVEFHRTKYGRELLVDAAFIHAMPTFIKTLDAPHTLAFHDILLVTQGRGQLDLDAEACPVKPGVVLFSRPGQVRRWKVRGLDGACLFFSEEFVTGSFSDARFLEQFGYFRDGRPSAALALAPAERKAFLERFAAMQREIARLPGDAPHALRALLYEVLVQLNRCYAARYGVPRPEVPSALLARFGALVERDFARRHRLGDYAAELGVSPGHLSAQCRLRLGESAGARIRVRLMLEAKRLLLFGGETVAEIADRLGFDDPAYFARFFRREAGCPPARYRADRQGRVNPAAPRRGAARTLA